MVQRCLKVAETFLQEGIEIEIVDPRTLLPLDKKTLIQSAKKTGKVLIVHEAVQTGGLGAETRLEDLIQSLRSNAWAAICEGYFSLTISSTADGYRQRPHHPGYDYWHHQIQHPSKVHIRDIGFLKSAVHLT